MATATLLLTDGVVELAHLADCDRPDCLQCDYSLRRLAARPIGEIADALTLADEARATLYRPHPDRPHYWFRYPFESADKIRCGTAGCHARPADVVVTAEGHDSGYVTFKEGERRF
jgi:hypothetical protein